LHARRTLLHRPALVLLDEPTGADVQTRTQILDLVRDLAGRGSAVVYSTHYLPEIETLGADVAFLDRGRIVARGRTAELVEQLGTSALELTFATDVPAAARVDGAVVEGATVRIPASDPAARAAQLLPALGADAGAPGFDRDPPLEPRVGVPRRDRTPVRRSLSRRLPDVAPGGSARSSPTSGG
jgi:ABC-2 type transport system ATP-binding protein